LLTSLALQVAHKNKDVVEHLLGQAFDPNIASHKARPACADSDCDYEARTFRYP
jgi:hypothetical protein